MEFIHTILRYPVAVALLLNGILLVLTILRNKRIKGKYQLLMVVYRIVSIVINSIEIAIIPILIIDHNGVLAVNAANMNPYVVKFCLPFFFSTYVILIILQAISLVYRTLFLRIKHKKIFSNIGLALMASMIILSGVTLSVIDFVFPPEEEFVQLQKQVFNLSEIVLNNSIGGRFMSDNGRIGHGFYVFASHGFVIGVFYLISIISMIGFHWFSEEPASAYTMKLQKNLSNVMRLQVFTPLIVAFLPGLAAHGHNFPHNVAFWFSAFLPIAQLADPLWSFLLIKDYNPFCFQKKKVTVTGVQMVPRSSHN